MNELSWFFTCSYTDRKAKSYFEYTWTIVNYGCDLLGPKPLNQLHLKNELINSINFLHAGIDFKNFGQTTNHALYVWLLNTELQCSCTCYLIRCFSFVSDFGSANIAQSYLILHFTINCVLPLVILGFTPLLLLYLADTISYSRLWNPWFNSVQLGLFLG